MLKDNKLLNKSRAVPKHRYVKIQIPAFSIEDAFNGETKTQRDFQKLPMLRHLSGQIFHPKYSVALFISILNSTGMLR